MLFRSAVPVCRAGSHETVTFVTKDCFDNQFTEEGDVLDSLNWDCINPATGPVYVEGAIHDYHFSLTSEQVLSFDQYAGLLTEWNEKINLTSILQPKEICIKHFLDSVLLLDAVGGMEKGTLIDVGTGAGFPSVPCKIIRPELKVTLLDSLQKRIHFLSVLSDELGQDNHCVHGRAEELGRKAEYREQFDFATARAVAHLRELSEYCLPFVKTGGCFAALKGYAHFHTKSP